MFPIHNLNPSQKSDFCKLIQIPNQDIDKYPTKSAMIYENRLPNIAFKGNYMLGPNNQDRNRIWTKKFDAAFDSKDSSEFLKFVNEKTRLAPLFEPTSKDDIIETKVLRNFDNEEFPTQEITLVAQSKPDNISIIANKSAHVQIHNSYLGNLFIDRKDLDKEGKMDDVNKAIIADGARGFDPFDQEDWQKTIGRKWPTADNMHDPNGVAILTTDKTKKAVFLDTQNTITSSYGTKPRAIAVLDSENDSVILAFQQENQNPDINFAAWSILPFRIRDDKKTVAIFPADKKSIKNIKDKTNDTFSEFRQSSQINIDDNKFFVIDVSKPSEKTEYVDPYADWCVFATQDDNTVCLVRSCYKDNTDNKQFKVFSGKEDLGGTKYAELEFIAPKVPKGQKSTLVYRIDFIPLKKLNIESLNAENMDENIKKIGELVEQKVSLERTKALLALAEA